jgi:hypothetical protein
LDLVEWPHGGIRKVLAGGGRSVKTPRNSRRLPALIHIDELGGGV